MDGSPSRPVAALLRREAVELVAHSGLASLTEDKLAARAGVNEAVLREAHGDANGCLLAAYDELCDELLAELQTGFEADLDWVAALRQAMSRLLHWCALRPAASRLMFYEITRGDHTMRSHREQARQRFVDLLMDEYRARPENEELPETQMEVLFGAVHQAVSGWVEAGREQHLPRLMPELAALAAVFEPMAA